LLDTHVVQWWSAEPRRLSRAATRTLEEADELAVAAISWWELAWLAKHERIVVTIPIRSWLEQLAAQLRTIGVPPRSPTRPCPCRHRSRAIPRIA